MNVPLVLSISACFDCTSRLILPPSLPAAQVLRFARSSPPPRYQAAVCACVYVLQQMTRPRKTACVYCTELTDCDCGRLGSRLLNSPLAVYYIIHNTHTHIPSFSCLCACKCAKHPGMRRREMHMSGRSKGAVQFSVHVPLLGAPKCPKNFRCARPKLQTPQKPPPLPKNRA
jgi:hypothetical protein